MTDDVRTRARARFDRLRADALDAFDDGHLASALAAPPPPPSGWCVAALARTTDAGALDDDLDTAVAELGADVWPYPARSQHVSVIALTAREPAPIDLERADRLAAAVGEAIERSAPFGFVTDGIGLIGTQLFAEVVPEDGRWAELRRTVGSAAIGCGERPLLHDDAEPVHLNLARLTGPEVDLDRLRRLLRRPRRPRAWRVTEIEIVVTDFVVSDEATTTVRCFRTGRR